jgi:hypothetical protein
MKLLNPIEQSPSHKPANKQFITELQEQISDSRKTPRFILDRYEGNYAICENQSTGQIVQIPKNQISPLAQDGDILKFKKNRYKIAFKETRLKKEEMKKLLNSLK